jgi:hypothetical protein
MAITPLYVTETHKALSVTWTDDSNTPINLTGATITARYNDGAVSTAGTGTATIVSAVAGTFTYAFSAADVATAGKYQWQFKANYGGTDLLFSDPITIEIKALL